MAPHHSYIVVGVLLTALAILVPRIGRWPVTTSLVYLVIGVAMGPLALGWIDLDPETSSRLLERLSEIAVTVALFASGLTIRLPRDRGRMLLPIRLAFGSMALTVGLIAVLASTLLGLSWGAAVLLGAVLAPTDPVLASQVELKSPQDQDRLRFGLTSEAALNDGTAFPFVMLGLGLLGLHDLGQGAWRWLAIDVVWAIGGGLAIGALIGWAAGSLVGARRRHHRRNREETPTLDDFLTLGLLALTYGLALQLATYGFLAAAALGFALRHAEARALHRGGRPSPDRVAAGVDADEGEAPVVSQTLLEFNKQLERLLEVGLVLLVGGMLSRAYILPEALWFVPLVLLVVRPLAVWLGLLGARLAPMQRPLLCWFGIRGIGSVYYLSFAIQHGLEPGTATTLTGLMLATVAVSVVVHGLSVSPLMRRYERRREAGAPRAPSAPAVDAGISP